MRTILKFVLVFAVGIAGGIFGQQVFLAYFGKEMPVNLAQGNSLREQKIFIEENTALQEAVERVKKSVIGIETPTKKGKITGSGLFITSDGLAITLESVVPKSSSPVFYVDSKMKKGEVLKRDKKSGLVLLKIEGENFPTCPFAEKEKIALGERVFLVGFRKIKDKVFVKEVNEGIVKLITDDYLKTNIYERSSFSGSPLFNIKGELVGLASIGKDRQVFAVPINEIRNFIGF